MPSVALAQGFGRIRCLLAGCCYGKETDSIFAITFHESEFAPNNVPLIPTEIYSSVLDFAHFALLLFIASRKKKDGQVAACYLIFYSIGRFILEFFRGDLIRGSVGVLSTSQFISLFTGAAGIIILILRSKKSNAWSRLDLQMEIGFRFEENVDMEITGIKRIDVCIACTEICAGDR